MAIFKGDTFSKPPFWVSMLVFSGVLHIQPGGRLCEGAEIFFYCSNLLIEPKWTHNESEQWLTFGY